VSKIHGTNMTARVLATTNPIREINSVEDMLMKLDKSFLSRWLIYYQPRDHVKMIQRARAGDMKVHEYNFSNDDWISIIDYLHTFESDFNQKKVDAVLDEVIPTLTSDLKEHYETRHRHHITCLIDGIIKTRCLFEHDMLFKGKPEDYEMLEQIWFNLIKSWIDPSMIKKMPIDKRRYYLPEPSQFLYEKICEEKRPLERLEMEEIALKGMSKNEYIDAFVILEENGLVTQREGKIFPFYMKNGGQKKL